MNWKVLTMTERKDKPRDHWREPKTSRKELLREKWDVWKTLTQTPYPWFVYTLALIISSYVEFSEGNLEFAAIMIVVAAGCMHQVERKWGEVA